MPDDGDHGEYEHDVNQPASDRAEQRKPQNPYCEQNYSNNQEHGHLQNDEWLAPGTGWGRHKHTACRAPAAQCHEPGQRLIPGSPDAFQPIVGEPVRVLL